MKNVLVTGGAGFIGSNFIRFLLEKLEEDGSVINIDRQSYCSRPPNITDSRYTFYRVDINDGIEVSTILKKHKIDTVLHFAAQTHVDLSFVDSVQFTQDNVAGLNSLLECCRLYDQIKLFIHFSTDEVYGDVPLDHSGCLENSSLNPTNPYAATKASAEFLVRSYGHSYGFPYIITRSNNVYGPFQYPDKIIPKFVKNLQEGKKCDIHGDGLQRRLFIHIDDVNRAVWILLHHGKIGEIYNIGSTDEFSVLQVHEKMMKILRPNENPTQHREFVQDRPYNDQRYTVDCTKLKNLGWTQQISFDDGLKSTIQWYNKNNDYWNKEKLKWLVFGHAGWIGQMVCSLIESRGEIVLRAQSRADQPFDVEHELDRVLPDRVLSIIGRTHGPGNSTIDWLEEPGHLVDNIRDNLFAPLVLAESTKKRKTHLTYLGTGCIFTSTEDQPKFNEDDEPNFFGSSYSVVKGFTDRLMKFYNENVLNCRIRMPIASDDSPRNFIMKITSYEKIHSVPNSMTVLEDILPKMLSLARSKETGTYNMVNPGIISHNQILEMYKEIIKEDFQWKNFSEKELLSVLKAARSNNELETLKLELIFPEILPINDAVRQVLIKKRHPDVLQE